jgi:hypothetical protein
MVFQDAVVFKLTTSTRIRFNVTVFNRRYWYTVIYSNPSAYFYDLLKPGMIFEGSAKMASFPVMQVHKCYLTFAAQLLWTKLC